jgi:6-pyruvoyltetrahydropterin/6-carboxytetrahydropterin synthase
MPRTSARKAKQTPPAGAPAGPVVVTRSVHFNAAHRLHNPAKSAAWNRKTYGKCNNPNWHGHNYTLEASVLGHPDPLTGYVFDLNDLKAVIESEILAPCDHKNLNLDVPFLRGVIPSTENLVIAFWQRIEPRVKNGRLYRLRLWETDRNSADYYGPAGPQPM